VLDIFSILMIFFIFGCENTSSAQARFNFAVDTTSSLARPFVQGEVDCPSVYFLERERTIRLLIAQQ
jgi:hypothetical protein